MDFVPNCRYNHHQKFVAGLKFRFLKFRFFWKITLEFQYKRKNEEGKREELSLASLLSPLSPSLPVGPHSMVLRSLRITGKGKMQIPGPQIRNPKGEAQQVVFSICVSADVSHAC